MKKPVEKTFGEVLKAYRKKHGMTQAELGDLLGLKNPQTDISQFESGREPTADILRLVCRTSGLSADYLLGLKP